MDVDLNAQEIQSILHWQDGISANQERMVNTFASSLDIRGRSSYHHCCSKMDLSSGFWVSNLQKGRKNCRQINAGS